MTAATLRSATIERTELVPRASASTDARRVPARGYAWFAFACAVLYALLGMWTITRSGYMIGDAAYRVSNARVILFSRDPHLAAIGMTWMPLSTLATLPFALLLQPFGLGWASGAVMSACFGGGTLWMLAKLSRYLDASVPTTVVVLALFALNPVNVFWMGSAMMEAPALFFLSWACLAWIRWLRDRLTTDLAVVGVALGLGVMTRYEQLVVTMVFCALAFLACEKGRRFQAIVIVAVPSIAVLFVWCVVNFVIRGSFFAFLDSGRSGEGADACGFVPVSLRVPEDNIYGWCQVKLSILDGVEFGAQRVLRFAPVFVLGAPLLLAADLRRRVRRSPVLAFVLATLATPAFVTLLTWRERTSGNPRYFYASILLAPLLCLLVAGRDRNYGRAWFPVLAAVMTLGVATSVHMELTERFSGIEHEDTALSRLTGLDQNLLEGAGATEERGDNVALWREAAAEIDRLTSDGDIVAMDSSTTFQVLLFSRHLDRFAIPEDRDFEQLLSLSESRFTFIVVTGSEKSATGVDERLAAIINGANVGQTYKQVADLAGVGQLWQLQQAANP